MRGIVFAVLTLLLGAFLGLGLEKVASFFPMQLEQALTRVYGIGVHPLSLHISLCGMVGLVVGYIIVSKFVRK